MLKYRIIKKVVLHDSLDYDQAKYAIQNMEEEEKEELHIEEYELKEKWNEDMIMSLKESVEVMQQEVDILSEEVKITSTMIQDGTEADSKLDELNKQLEELRNKKPNTRVIVKEVKVDKKGRKL